MTWDIAFLFALFFTIIWLTALYLIYNWRAFIFEEKLSNEFVEGRRYEKAKKIEKQIDKLNKLITEKNEKKRGV